MRFLQRALRIGGASVQRDLGRLVTLGALERFSDGRFVRYRMANESPLWTAFRIMIGATADPVALIGDALRDVRGIHAAFIYGSTAADTRRHDSDVDVFVVEDPTVDRKTLHSQLAEAGTLLRCDVNAVRYTPQTLATRLRHADHAGGRFVREVFAGPKAWIVGDTRKLRRLAAASGVAMPTFYVQSSGQDRERRV